MASETNNPIQRRPASIGKRTPWDKFDAGTRRTPADTVGPTRSPEPINQSGQTSIPGGRSSSTGGRGDKARQVSREDRPQGWNYGVT